MLSYAFDISGFLENIENCDFGRVVLELLIIIIIITIAIFLELMSTDFNGHCVFCYRITVLMLKEF